MIEEHRMRRFILPLPKSDVGKGTVKFVGSKLFNEKASLLKLNVSIKTFKRHVNKMYMVYIEDQVLLKFCMIYELLTVKLVLIRYSMYY